MDWVEQAVEHFPRVPSVVGIGVEGGDQRDGRNQEQVECGNGGTAGEKVRKHGHILTRRPPQKLPKDSPGCPAPDAPLIWRRPARCGARAEAPPNLA
jgi:hypothetical protein